MENRKEVIQEYFKLRVFLNKANLKSNEKTELDFEVRRIPKSKNYLFVAYLKGASNQVFISLCQNNTLNHWSSETRPGFYNLAKYCANELNVKQLQLGSADLEQSKLTLVDYVRIRLSSLGLG